MSEELLAQDFARFFEAVHGYEPFPWQSRLAQRAFAEGWPAALDVPTGAGKTAAIDIAVFHLVLQAHLGSERRAPVRILFVVDRRLIVDEAHERALKIARALADARDGVLARAADRLRLLAEDPRRPLVVARLRGGVPKEPDWVRTPAQPVILVSTVDQAGSRLLFRGYGVSDAMKSVQAGLLGADSLLLLDEAHLSQPFVQTTRETRAFQDKGLWSADTAHAPFGIVTLSATQVEKPEPFVLDDDRQHRILGPRLSCSKPAELTRSAAAAGDQGFAEEFADRAWTLSRTGSGTAVVVAIVVNRVNRARDIFERLRIRGALPLEPGASPDRETSSGDALVDADLALLIGRTRELDRRTVMNSVLPRIKAGRERNESDRTLFIVATQCVEAGADFDFDALVTEIAPLDCLRQRFGRLNRMGQAATAQAVILAASDQIAKSAKPDSIYGVALKQTWSLLNEKCQVQGAGKQANSVIDFGIAATDTWLPVGDALAAFLAPQADAPMVLPRDLGFWSRTSPVPAVDPEVSLYLHGPARGLGDVQIVWRADLEGNDPREWIDRVRVCPPSPLESVSVPIAEAQRWLRRRADGDVADVEAVGIEDEPQDSSGERRALLWRGADDERTWPVTAKDVRPGDILVVSSLEGGCDRWGWAPRGEVRSRVKKLAGEFQDRGEEANEENRGRRIFRLSPVLLERALMMEGIDEDLRETRAERFRALLDELKQVKDRDVLGEIGDFFGLPKSWKERLGTLGRRPIVERTGRGEPLALEARERSAASGGEAVTEDDDSARAVQRSVRLDAHCQGVAARARRFAEQVGLVPALIEDVALAGFLHDSGKAHPQFKRLLYGGVELAALGGPPLAKSTRVPESPAAWGEARRRSGFPKGARHEVASLAFAEAHPKLALAHDPELVLWLIGTHHGHGRPFFPPIDWPGGGTVVLEADLGDGMVVAKPTRTLAELTARWVDLFARLEARYGPWGLARLESILRLADHRQSEAEQSETHEPADEIAA